MDGEQTKKRNKKINVKEPEDLEIKHIDTFSLGYTEAKEFQINFGEFVSEDTIEVRAKIKFPPTVMKHFIFSLFELSEAYGKQFNTDLGFLDNVEFIEEEIEEEKNQKEGENNV